VRPEGGEGLQVQRRSQSPVTCVACQDHGLLPRRSGDRALPRVVLPGLGIGEPGAVVSELAEGAGSQDYSEARLAEVGVSGRVTAKMLCHHLLQLGDLLVQCGDDADLPGRGGRVGSFEGRLLTQGWCSEHHEQHISFGLDMVTASGPQQDQELTPRQLRRPPRIWCSLQELQGVLGGQVLESLYRSGEVSRNVERSRST